MFIEDIFLTTLLMVRWYKYVDKFKIKRKQN